MACNKKCAKKAAAPKAAAAAEKLFEGYERREAKILAALKPYGIKSILECKEICDKAGIDPYKIVEETQPICFENAKWAYTVGAAMAIKKGLTPNEAWEKAKGHYGQFEGASKYIDPRKD